MSQINRYFDQAALCEEKPGNTLETACFRAFLRFAGRMGTKSKLKFI